MKIIREEQKATSPQPTGSGQATKVSTHEGSQLSSPVKAGVSTKKV